MKPVWIIYLLNATRDYIMDAGGRPYISVHKDCVEPAFLANYANEHGMISLNVADHSITDWNFNGNVITFNTRFNKVATDVTITVTGGALVFDHDDPDGAQMFVDYIDLTDGSKVDDDANPEPAKKPNPFTVIDGGKKN